MCAEHERQLQQYRDAVLGLSEQVNALQLAASTHSPAGAAWLAMVTESAASSFYATAAAAIVALGATLWLVQLFTATIHAALWPA